MQDGDKKARKETVASESTDSHKKTRYDCVVELTSPLGSVRNPLIQDNMKITSRRKFLNSISHCNLVHKFIPMLQAMKITDAKAVDQER